MTGKLTPLTHGVAVRTDAPAGVSKPLTVTERAWKKAEAAVHFMRNSALRPADDPVQEEHWQVYAVADAIEPEIARADDAERRAGLAVEQDATTLRVQLKRCAGCQAPMVPKAFRLECPGWALQANRTFRPMSDFQKDDRPLCVDCATAGKAGFRCVLCNVDRGSDRWAESYGDPPERLCLDCYETVPAKVWDAKKDELLAAHQYDYC